jgi:hypothetical protein
MPCLPGACACDEGAGGVNIHNFIYTDVSHEHVRACALHVCCMPCVRDTSVCVDSMQHVRVTHLYR